MSVRAPVTKQSDEWETPDWLFRALDAEFGFWLDPAASTANHKCAKFYTKEDNGLVQGWDGPVFINPPYSNIEEWVWRAMSSAWVAVILLPVRTDNNWFPMLVKGTNAELRFFRKRIAFLENGVEMKSPPFASMVAVIR